MAQKMKGLNAGGTLDIIELEDAGLSTEMLLDLTRRLIGDDRNSSVGTPWFLVYMVIVVVFEARCSSAGGLRATYHAYNAMKTSLGEREELEIVLLRPRRSGGAIRGR